MERPWNQNKETQIPNINKTKKHWETQIPSIENLGKKKNWFEKERIWGWRFERERERPSPFEREAKSDWERERERERENRFSKINRVWERDRDEGDWIDWQQLKIRRLKWQNWKLENWNEKYWKLEISFAFLPNLYVACIATKKEGDLVYVPVV